MTSYINSFYFLGSTAGRVIETDATPTEYRGFQIYYRVKSAKPSARTYDIVKQGVCIGMYGGLSGATEQVDRILDTPTEFWAARALEQLAKNVQTGGR